MNGEKVYKNDVQFNGASSLICDFIVTIICKRIPTPSHVLITPDRHVTSYDFVTFIRLPIPFRLALMNVKRQTFAESIQWIQGVISTTWRPGFLFPFVYFIFYLTI